MNTAQEEVDLADLDGLGWQEWAIAAGVFVAGLVLAQIVGRMVRRLVERTPASPLMVLVLTRLAKGIVIFLGFYFALQSLGVPLGPLLGALGIVGLALAFAFQDILENVVAGLLMILRRPISIGDEVSTNDFDGTVSDITLRAVELTTLDGETVFIPNAMVWKNPLKNITTTPERRTTIEVGVAYGTDLDRAKGVLERAVTTVEEVHSQPAPTAQVYGFGASSIDFAVRYWHDAPTSTLWKLRDEVARAIKRSLDEAGIEIPFPQRVVHMVDRDSADD